MSDKVRAARLRAAKDRPYFAKALWALIMKETDKVPFPMAVDKFWRLYHNPALSEQWTVEEMATVLIHEISHLLRDHPGRAEALGIEFEPGEAFKFNVAGDMEINDDLHAERLPMPEGAVLPSTMGFKDGLMAEQYYRLLPQIPQMQRSMGQGQGEGEGQGQGQGQGDEEGDGQGEGENPQGKPMAGGGGSSGGGPQKDWEDGKPNEQSPGVSPARGKLLQAKVAEDIKEHVKNRGHVPGDWARWAEEITNPKVHWTKELNAEVRNAIAWQRGMVDYTYRRPSRRQSAFPEIVQPSMVAPTPNIAVVVDTSGSMSTKMLEQALGEIKGILKATGVGEGVSVLSVDAQVHISKKVFNASKVELQGGGGTDMGKGIEAAAGMKPRPDVVITLTDGYTPWPAEAPPFKSIIVIFAEDGDHGRWDTPDWSKVIYAPISE